MNFKEKLEKIVQKNNSLLCVGLDIDKEKMTSTLFETSKTPFLDFNKNIIDETKDLVCAYKLNMAFYEVLGKKGYDLLRRTINYIPEDIIVIVDGKRNDIGNTARKYAKSIFKDLNGDATTINPYLGYDGIELAVRDPKLLQLDDLDFLLTKQDLPVPAIGTGQAYGEEGLSFTDPDEKIPISVRGRIRLGQ